MSLELFVVVAPECIYAESNFYTALFLKTAVPIAALAIFWLVQGFRIWRWTRRMSLRSEQKNEHNVLVRRTVAHSANGTLMVLNLVLIPVCSAIFKMFSCAEFEFEGSFLVAQLDLSCTSEAHAFWKRYAVVMVTIYPIGVPAAMFAMMFIARAPIKTVLREMYRDLHKTNVHRGSIKDVATTCTSTSVRVVALGSMFNGFKPDYYWYGVLMIMVRLLLTSVLLFFSHPNVRIATASFISFVSFMMQRELMPQRVQADASVAHWCQFCIFVWIISLRMIDVLAPWLLTALGCALALAWLSLFFRVVGGGIHELRSDSSDRGARNESHHPMKIPQPQRNANSAAGPKTFPESRYRFHF